MYVPMARLRQTAWNDNNLRTLALHIRASPSFGHLWTSTGISVGEVNFHPSSHGKAVHAQRFDRQIQAGPEESYTRHRP